MTHFARPAPPQPAARPMNGAASLEGKPREATTDALRYSAADGSDDASNDRSAVFAAGGM